MAEESALQDLRCVTCFKGDEAEQVMYLQVIPLRSALLKKYM
jgi:hypothetical protein